MTSKESIIKTGTIVLFCLFMGMALFVCIDGLMKGHFQSIQTLQTYISSYGIWGPLLLLMIQLLQVILPILPGFAGCIVGSVLFGAANGFWINYIGITLGSIIAYFLAKRYGTKLVNKMMPMEKYQKYIDKINQSKSYTLLLFLAILLPLAPDDFLCYFSGLINMSSKKFITIIILAKPWCILGYCIFFAYFI
ncbi:MAG: VTT domain-containing protein [Erysipelotrichaceae bacterium]|uniref:TVP38/TMEM64 family protein n=1 Tax=Floccifex sp. TaxID=2815810 RepID=UPI002A764578|nr:VTT domain-containing protein [Floccifex sp.]MDD7280787.1 VTT domain-containing protein [Erysipelotrichaceae bacterium]MDY2957670.1 VTT domain-containing protein [Floccifex sp.]